MCNKVELEKFAFEASSEDMGMQRRALRALRSVNGARKRHCDISQHDFCRRPEARRF